MESSIDDPVKSAAREAAREHFHSLDIKGQQEWVDQFAHANASNTMLMKNIRKSGITSKLVEVPFMTWLAGELGNK